MDHQPQPTFWQVLLSILGALFGVQSSRVRERDFTRGRPWWVYGLVAIAVMAILILSLILLAQYLVPPPFQ